MSNVENKIIDSNENAEKVGRRSSHKKENIFLYQFREWGIPIIAAFALFLIITKFIFFNIQVPTPSMVPTIQVNDRIMVTRVHNTNKLERGDIVVFQSKEFNERYIKRLIGLPGETIEVKKNGTILVNGEKLDEPYVKNQVKEDEDYFGLHIGVYEVPEDSFFFLGDNRSNSKDARYWNNPYINKDDIMGKAQIVIFPFSRFGKLE